MKFKTLLALTIITGSLSAMAVQKPSITPVLGTYRGDCEIEFIDNEITIETEVKIEREGEIVKINLNYDGKSSLTAVKINEEKVLVDNVLNQKTTQLLKITDANLRNWTLTERISPIQGEGVEDLTETKFDFSNPSQVKIEAENTLGGEITHVIRCSLDKMNMRIK